MDTLDVVLENKEDAQLVLDALRDRLHEYGVVSVSDFFDLVDLPSSFIDQKWGWTDLSEATFSELSLSDKIKLDLPRPEPFK